MDSLIVPHGGIPDLVSRMVSEDEAPDVRSHAENLKRLPVSDADLSTVYRFGDGGLSPLEGPMGREIYDRVLEEEVLESAGSLFAWTIPLSLPVGSETASQLGGGETVALANAREEIVGTLDVSDVFPWDKISYLKHVYGTERTDHPGADMVLKGDAGSSHLVGGKIRVIAPTSRTSFDRYMLSPLQVRAHLKERGWDRVVAFQTRNPLHRAHEYALLYGLESLLQEGSDGAACLNPLVGETKADDVSAEIRMRTYEALIEGGELGQGDADETLWQGREDTVGDRVILLGLDMKMFYAGPKEAVMHAIYRQNFGFTDIIIGRKHADAPYHDGEPIWGDFDAQEIFERLRGALEIQPLKVGFAAFYESIGRVDLMKNHSDEKPVFISGKQVREMLQQGRDVDTRIMRASTSKILSAAMS